MTCRILTTLLAATSVSQLHAENLLWSDNFDVPDSTSFDTASLEGRRGGLLASEIVPRSANLQHSIVSGMLRLNGGTSGTGTGRLRFEVPPGGSPVASYDFAASEAGPHILSGGGLRVEFDFKATNSTNTSSGICFFTGFPTSATLAEPTGTRLTHTNTDIGILLQNNGATRLRKNAVSSNMGNYTPTTALRHVVIDYGFTSYDDGSPVTIVVTVDGTEVINQAHTWSGNSGQFLVELGDALLGTLVDNLQIFDKSAPRLGLAALDNPVFKSDLPSGGDVATLGALLGGYPGEATYSLVSGEGSTDNGKFQIAGNKLQVGAYSFLGANATEGQQFSVRVRATSTAGGGHTTEKVFLLTVTEEDDSDGLPDAWEIVKTGNITTLNGDGVADFDGDGLSDLEEYKVIHGTSEIYPLSVLPNLNPLIADSDADGLKDREELDPGYQLFPNERPPTNPTMADTDGDGFSDLIESNSGTYGSAADTGTNPMLVDSDFDGLRDDFEMGHLADGYDPTVNDSSLDTDGDGLTTAQELASGSSLFLTDTDDDGLTDAEEVTGTAGQRPATSPIRVDTDYDGLSDLAETNTGTYLSATNTGTNPVKNDTDGDFARDGAELAAGSDPFSASSVPPLPPGVTVGPLTTNESSGIGGKPYTHAFSGGNSALFPGITLAPYTPTTPSSLVPNVTWDSFKADGTAADKQSASSDGQWVAATGDVTGAGLKELLRGYCHSNTGGAPGSKQVYTLSGLTPGKVYDLRLYHRSSMEPFTPSGRPIDLVFTNGTEVVTPFQSLPEDRPDLVLGGGSVHQAFYVNFRYRAQGTTLVIEAKVPLGGLANSGSYRFYGLTNETLPFPPFAITAISREPSGDVFIDFTGLPDTTYELTRSPDLIAPFSPFAQPITATTNSSGLGLVTVPAWEATGPKAFYRLEE